jgi:hypothetical protein
MEKKYFKSKENVFLKDVVIGDLCYLDSENDEIIEAARSRILYQENPQIIYHESLNRACTVELVIQEKPVTCPELGIVDPVNITSGSLIVQTCQNVINTGRFVTVRPDKIMQQAVSETDYCVCEGLVPIGCDTASIFAGRTECIDGDDCVIRTGADGEVGYVRHFYFPKVTTVRYEDGSTVRFASGFAAFIFDFEFDADMVSAEDVISYFSSSFGVELEEQTPDCDRYVSKKKTVKFEED